MEQLDKVFHGAGQETQMGYPRFTLAVNATTDWIPQGSRAPAWKDAWHTGLSKSEYDQLDERGLAFNGLPTKHGEGNPVGWFGAVIVGVLPSSAPSLLSHKPPIL